MSKEISSILYFLDIDLVEKEWNNICENIFYKFKKTNFNKIKPLIELLNKKNYKFAYFFYKNNKRDSGFYLDIGINIKNNKTNQDFDINFMVLSIHIKKEDLELIKEYTKKGDYEKLNSIYSNLVSFSPNGIIHIHSDNNWLFDTFKYNCNYKLTQNIEKIIDKPTTADDKTPQKFYKPSFQIEYIRNEEAKQNKNCLLLQPIFDSFMLSIEKVLFSKRYMIDQFKTTYNLLLSNIKEIRQFDRRGDEGVSKKLFEKYLNYKMKYINLKKLIYQNIEI